MQFPDTPETRLTENIMFSVKSRLKPSTSVYNAIYSFVYDTVSKNITHSEVLTEVLSYLKSTIHVKDDLLATLNPVIETILLEAVSAKRVGGKNIHPSVVRVIKKYAY